MEETKELATIYSSYDYKSFKVLTYNRKKNEHLVDALKGSIETHGFLMPILVTQINADGEYFIVDGQHRFWAAEAIGEAVKYAVIDIEEDKLPVLVSSINTIGKKWGPQDYQKMYVLLKKPGHLILDDFMKANAISLNETLLLFSIRGGANAGKMRGFRDGTLSILDEETEKAQAKWANAWAVVNSSPAWEGFKDDKTFRMAAILLTGMSGYVQDRMIGQLETKAARVVKCATCMDYQNLFIQVYNISLQAANRLMLTTRAV